MNNKKSLIIPNIDIPDSTGADALAGILMQCGAKARIDSVNWPDEYPSSPLSSAAIAHDSHNLHILFSVTASTTRALTTGDLGPVADDTCFEIFLKHPRSPRYWNYEFNILGTANVSSRTERRNPTRFGSDELNAINRISSCSIPRDITQGIATEWLMVSIPLKQIGIDDARFPILLEGNIYSCASALPVPYFLSWSPISAPTPDFHRPEYFGYIILE